MKPCIQWKNEVETPRNELKQVVILCVGESDGVVALVTTETNAEHKIKYAFALGTVIKIILQIARLRVPKW